MSNVSGQISQVSFETSFYSQVCYQMENISKHRCTKVSPLKKKGLCDWINIVFSTTCGPERKSSEMTQLNHINITDFHKIIIVIIIWNQKEKAKLQIIKHGAKNHI